MAGGKTEPVRRPILAVHINKENKEQRHMNRIEESDDAIGKKLKEGRKSQVLRDDDIQNRCNEDVPCTGADTRFSPFFLSLLLCFSLHTL